MGIRGCSRSAAVICLIIAAFIPCNAQDPLYPGLSGESLIDAIRADYTPTLWLTEAQTRDTLYKRIFMVNDSVRCIYSGMARHIPSAADPSQWLYGSGSETWSVNLEHSWPQAKGAGNGTEGNRDMHHLYPARSRINSMRANYPYREIPDQQTQRWFYNDQEMTTMPVADIMLYSESASGMFEPRESVKGDIARAMFYFWSIYREDALAADPDFFELQRDAFCTWHHDDPVDPEEWDRTHRIAQYQGGVPNPFILDCSLVERAYCQEGPTCLTSSAGPAPVRLDVLRYDAGQQVLMIEESVPATWTIRVFDLSGRTAFSCHTGVMNYCELPDLIPGMYVAVASSRHGTAHIMFVKP